MSENTKMTQSFSDILSPLGEKYLQAAGRFFEKTEFSHNIQTAKNLLSCPVFATYMSICANRAFLIKKP